MSMTDLPSIPFELDEALNGRCRTLLAHAYRRRTWPSTDKRVALVQKSLTLEGRTNDEIAAVLEISKAVSETASSLGVINSVSAILTTISERSEVPRGERGKFRQWLGWGFREFMRAEASCHRPKNLVARELRRTKPTDFIFVVWGTKARTPSRNIEKKIAELHYLQRQQQRNAYELYVENRTAKTAPGRNCGGDMGDPEAPRR